MIERVRRFSLSSAILMALLVSTGFPSSYAGMVHVTSTNTEPAAYITDLLPAYNFSTLIGNPANLTAAGSLLFFTAQTSTGDELWKSDGTAAGTILVRDIFPGSGGSQPQALTSANGILFFTADDGAHGRELWKSDGSAAGTVPVADINPGSSSSEPFALINVNGTLFFTADNGANGRELWKSDGSAAGTVLVRDLNPGFASTFSLPLVLPGMVNVNGTLFFNATTNDHGMELWKSDGSEAGTVRVSNIASDAYPSGISSRSLSNLNGTVIFVANDGVSGYELWRSDGTIAGTMRIGDINPGANSSFAVDLWNDQALLNVVNGNVFFTADDGVSGTELWKSDGTEGGTQLVSDINAGPSGSFPTNFIQTGDLLFFLAQQGGNPRGLWRSDGAPAGTFEVRADVGNAFATELSSSSGTLYFTDDDNPGNLELWKSDGTIANTTLVRDIFPGNQGSGISGLTNVAGILMFVANDGGGSGQIWKSDGSTSGTVRITRIAPPLRGTYLSNLAAIDDTVFFARDDNVSGIELWKSDGTTTSRVRDINQGTISGIPLSSLPRALTPINQTLFFAAEDSAGGMELWKSDGTEAGTVRVRDINPGPGSSLPRLDEFSPTLPPNLVNINGTLYFTANDGVSGVELWKSDGTEAGTVRVRDINPGPGSAFPTSAFQGISNTLVNAQGTLFFIADNGVDGYELWKSDGTESGTVRVRDIAPGYQSAFLPSAFSWISTPPAASLTAVGTIVFFVANTGDNDFELWKSDGTEAGTVRVRDINPGTSPAFQSPVAPSLTNVNGMLFFVADDGTSGFELWKSDGSAAGTQQVRDILPGARGLFTSSNSAFGSSFAPELTDVNGTLFFAANDGTGGYELWKSDGSAAGTTRVRDIAPGLPSSAPMNLTAVNGMLMFAASDPQLGIEWWRSDGTSAGTTLVQDIAPDIASSEPAQFIVGGDRLFFRAYTVQGANALWAAPVSALSTKRVFLPLVVR